MIPKDVQMNCKTKKVGSSRSVQTLESQQHAKWRTIELVGIGPFDAGARSASKLAVAASNTGSARRPR